MSIKRKHESSSVYITAAQTGGVYVMYSYLGGTSSRTAPTAALAVEAIIAADVWIGPGSRKNAGKESTLRLLRTAASDFDRAAKAVS